MPFLNLLANFASSSSKPEHDHSFSSVGLSSLKAASPLVAFPFGILISYAVKEPCSLSLFKVSNFVVYSIAETLGLNLEGNDLKIL